LAILDDRQTVARNGRARQTNHSWGVSMGKGDRRSRKGKIFRGTTGKKRPRAKKSATKKAAD
jgi:30S ribosomal protein S31